MFSWSHFMCNKGVERLSCNMICTKSTKCNWFQWLLHHNVDRTLVQPCTTGTWIFRGFKLDPTFTAFPHEDGRSDDCLELWPPEICIILFRRIQLYIDTSKSKNTCSKYTSSHALWSSFVVYTTTVTITDILPEKVMHKLEHLYTPPFQFHD